MAGVAKAVGGGAGGILWCARYDACLKAFYANVMTEFTWKIVK